MVRKRQRGSGMKGESERERGLDDRWGFLVPHLKLFRRSSLIVITALGRSFSGKFHVRELARSLGYDVSIISKNLKQLEEAGLLTHEDVGNLVFYQADMESVLLRQMKIFLTLLELNDLRKDLDRVTTNFILYGSCARGEDTHESDIDLFIEALDKEAVREILGRHQRVIARLLSPVVSTPDEAYRLKAEESALFQSIQQGIILKQGVHVA